MKASCKRSLNKYGLQSLYPLEGIQSFLPKALAEVCIMTSLPVALRQLWSSTVRGVKLSASVHVSCGLTSILGPHRNMDIGRGSVFIAAPDDLRRECRASPQQTSLTGSGSTLAMQRMPQSLQSLWQSSCSLEMLGSSPVSLLPET